MAYIRHDKNNNAVDPQPGSTDASDLGGNSGWTEVSYKNFNADYEAHDHLNQDRTPGTYQARNTNNTVRTPAAYVRHDKDNNPLVAALKLVVGARFQDGYRGAAFIFNDVNDLNTSIKVNSSDTSAYDTYGFKVAIGNDKIAVGMQDSDDNGSSSGSAFTYDLDGTNELKFTASDAAAGDNFGSNVAIGHGKIVIGAEDKGNGAAYIYNLDGTGEVKVTASNGSGTADFGNAVAITSDKVYVGAPRQTVDGDGMAGAVYIYNHDGTGEAILTASDSATFSSFGSSLAIGHDKLLVGANTDPVAGPGAVYVYDLDGTNELKITASDGASGDRFGYGIAIGNNKIAVGAYNDDDTVNDSGSAYVYNLDGTGEVKINASDPESVDQFGFSVAIGGDKVYVGARYEDEGGNNSGSIYVYNLDGTGEVKVPNPEGDGNGRFGVSMALG